jgi:predicted ATPase
LDAQLLALDRKGLIDRGTAEKELLFHHALVRDVAYAGIPKAARADLHERFAAWLDGQPAGTDEIVGYHLEQAWRSYSDLRSTDAHALGIAAAAGARLGAAGIEAASRDEPVATVNLLGRALRLLPRDDPLRPALLCTFGVYLWTAGDIAGAREAFDER